MQASLPDRWPVRWGTLCRDLIEQLPPEALDALRVNFNLRGATSVEHFFAITNRAETWTTGAVARDSLRDLADVLRPWERIEAVHALRAQFNLA